MVISGSWESRWAISLFMCFFCISYRISSVGGWGISREGAGFAIFQTRNPQGLPEPQWEVIVGWVLVSEVGSPPNGTSSDAPWQAIAPGCSCGTAGSHPPRHLDSILYPPCRRRVRCHWSPMSNPMATEQGTGVLIGWLKPDCSYGWFSVSNS